MIHVSTDTVMIMSQKSMFKAEVGHKIISQKLVTKREPSLIVTRNLK